MVAIRKTSFYLIISLLTVLLFGCGEPAADQEEIEEELQEEVEENDEYTKEEEDNEEDDDVGNDSSAGNGSGTSGSGFSHTVEMDINGEVKEGEGEEWWKDEEEDNDEWWDD